MRRIFTLAAALLGMTALMLSTACASGSNTGPRRSANVLTAEEIATVTVNTAAEAIQRLRPQWLNTRSSPTMSNPNGEPPTVYVDGLRMDGIRELERVRAVQVQEIRFLRPSDATNRFGTGHTGGAIVVTTKNGP